MSTTSRTLSPTHGLAFALILSLVSGTAFAQHIVRKMIRSVAARVGGCAQAEVAEQSLSLSGGLSHARLTNL